MLPCFYPAGGFYSRTTLYPSTFRSMMKRILVAALLCAGLFSVRTASAQLVNTKMLTIEAAKAIAQAAEAEARANGWTVSISIVDPGGHQILFHRMDGASPGTAIAAFQKAESSALFRAPTKNFEDVIAGGRNALIGLEVMTPLQGGLPIRADGQVIGAIGISGGTSPQDEQMAQAGVNALRP